MEIREQITRTKGGSIKAQQKMVSRLEQAGAMEVHLVPGKRGKYELYWYEWNGWDPETKKQIKIVDQKAANKDSRKAQIFTLKNGYVDMNMVIPDKPWLACVLKRMQSLGNGLMEMTIQSVTTLLVTHHALSRMAQRYEVRSVEDLLVVSQKMLNILLPWYNQVTEAEWNSVQGRVPPFNGWKINMDKATLVVLPHEEPRLKMCMVVVTVL